MEFSKTKKYKTDSGLGGVFNIRFLYMEGQEFVFQVLNNGFESLILRFSEATKSQIKEA